jgi:putative transposase
LLAGRIFGTANKLVRYQQTGDLHFVTFSCYQRRPYLGSAAARDQLVESLETMRVRYGCGVSAYVVMPEHVHLLVSEPETIVLARALMALNISVARQSRERPFWQVRYYDFNVWSVRKIVEKRKYIHRNPVARGLVGSPEEWKWSSYRSWSTGEAGMVAVDCEWRRWKFVRTRAVRLGETLWKPTSQNREVGHPPPVFGGGPEVGHPPISLREKIREFKGF